MSPLLDLGVCGGQFSDLFLWSVNCNNVITSVSLVGNVLCIFIVYGRRRSCKLGLVTCTCQISFWSVSCSNIIFTSFTWFVFQLQFPLALILYLVVRAWKFGTWRCFLDVFSAFFLRGFFFNVGRFMACILGIIFFMLKVEWNFWKNGLL